VDAVVVLTGGVRRVEHGMELYMRDGAKALFISGVGKDVKYRELEALYAPHVNSEKLEAKKQNVFLGYTAHNTIGNAKETAEWMEKHGFKSMLLVTSNYHIPRSVMEFRHLMPKVTIIPEPVFSQEVMDGREWWASFSAVKMLLLEFHKYCFRRIYLWLAEI
ncbi:MAG: YdcF family protein, partial [Rickettsiales bacterium]